MARTAGASSVARELLAAYRAERRLDAAAAERARTEVPAPSAATFVPGEPAVAEREATAEEDAAHESPRIETEAPEAELVVDADTDTAAVESSEDEKDEQVERKTREAEDEQRDGEREPPPVPRGFEPGRRAMSPRERVPGPIVLEIGPPVARTRRDVGDTPPDEEDGDRVPSRLRGIQPELETGEPGAHEEEEETSPEEEERDEERAADEARAEVDEEARAHEPPEAPDEVDEELPEVAPEQEEEDEALEAEEAEEKAEEDIDPAEDPEAEVEEPADQGELEEVDAPESEPVGADAEAAGIDVKPGGGGLGAAPELDAWKSRADAAAAGMEQPDLGPPADRTGDLADHATNTVKAGQKRRKELPKEAKPKEAKAVFDAKERTVDDIGKAADILAEDPTGAAKRIDAAARKKGLPAQKLPNLEPTPRGYLPNLYGDPISPQVLEQLRKDYAAYLPPKGERPKDFDEMAALIEGMKNDPDLDGRIAVFEGQTISGFAIPPQPIIAEAHQTDIAGVLARIITESESLPTKWIDTAREHAYRNGALALEQCFPTLGAEWVPQEAEFLRGEMQRVREAAGISKEKLDEAIRARQEQLAGDKQLAAQQGEQMFEDTSDKVEADFEQTQGLIQGLRQEWEDWADARAAAPGVDHKAIRARQYKMERAVRDMANDWIVAYDDMFKERKRKLGKASAEQAKAYGKAIRKDYELDLEEAGDDEAKIKAVKEDKKYETWVKDRMKVVTETIKEHNRANDKLYKGWQDEMRDVRSDALEKLQAWGDKQIGRKRGWFDRFLAWLFEWRDSQKSEARAFAKQRARETTAAMGSNLAALYAAKARFGETLDADEKKQLEGMSLEQRTVIESYYTNGGDAIGAVAAGLKIRLQTQRVARIKKAMIEHVMATPTNSKRGLRVAHLAKALGEDVFGAASKARSGFEYTWGTHESRVFAALRKVRSPVGAKGLRAAYWNRYHEDFDRRLKSELAGGWPDDEEDYHKAKSILEQDKVGEAAADLRRAVEGAGTDEALINEALRRFPPDKRKAVLAEYQRKYGEDLMARLDSELSGNEWKISNALATCSKDGDAKADAVEIRSAQFGVMGPSRDKMEKAYKRIREEEYRWARAEKKPPSSDEIEKRIRERHAKVAAQYKEEYDIGLETSVRRSFALDPTAADLVIGLQRQNWKMVDAARLEIERTGSYADDDTINDKVLGAGFERAFERKKYDAEIQLMREERAHLEKHPGAGPWTAKYRLERKEQLLAEARKAAEKESIQHLAELKSYYIDTYGDRMPLWQTRGKTKAEAFDQLIRGLTQGAGEDEAEDRLRFGGALPVERAVHHAIKDGDKDAIKAHLNGKSKAELLRIKKAYEEQYEPPPTFEEAVLGELSGRDKNDMKIHLEHGEPTDPATALEIAEAKLAYERRTGGQRLGHKRERFRDLELLVEQLRQDKERYEAARADPTLGKVLTDKDTGARYYANPIMGAYQTSWQTGMEAVNDIVQVHRAEVDAEANLISGLVAMVVAVVVGALLAPFTAGASLGLILLVAGAIATAATAATIATKWALKGDAYSKDELMMDAAFGVVDFVVTAVTLGAGKFIAPILKGTMKAAQAGKTTVKEAFKSIAKGAGKGAGKRIWTQGAKRAALHQAETEAAGGLFSTLAVPAFMDEYGQGLNPFASTLLSIGLAMGGGIAVGKGMQRVQRARPATFDFHAQAKAKGKSSDLIDIRGNPEKLKILEDAYLRDNPHKTAADFLSDYDDVLLKLMKDKDFKAKWQTAARKQMLEYVPPNQKAQFVDTPIEMIGDKEFRRLTGSRRKGEAVVIIKDGKPTVILRQGASPSALRREATHLLQMVDAKWKPRVDMLDEGNLINWHTKDTREKLLLYRAKIELEIDAAVRDLDMMKRAAHTADPPPGIAREIAEVEATLTNLRKRLGEVRSISPLRQTLMAWGMWPEPQYLRHKPRLFSKRGPRGPPVEPEAPPADVARKRIVEPYAGPDLDSPAALARSHPEAEVIATEATILPNRQQVKRLEDAGGVFVPDNMPASIRPGSVDEIKMRFPLPHDRAVKQDFLRRLGELQTSHPERPRMELMQEAMAETVARVETATAYGPYALQRLKPGGKLEVVFWERNIANELDRLRELRFIDPDTGRGFRFELEPIVLRPKREVAPLSGFGVPVEADDLVSVGRLRKVELDSKLPTGARGELGAGEVVGRHSGRPFFPDRAGLPIQELDYSRIKFTTKGVDTVEAHIRRFEGGGDMELAMLERLRRIAAGTLEPTDFDRAFYSHELREFVRYRHKGWRTGQPKDRLEAYELWNDLHTATLEDYRLRELTPEGQRTLFHPDIAETPATRPTGGRGPEQPHPDEAVGRERAQTREESRPRSPAGARYEHLQRAGAVKEGEATQFEAALRELDNVHAEFVTKYGEGALTHAADPSQLKSGRTIGDIQSEYLRRINEVEARVLDHTDLTRVLLAGEHTFEYSGALLARLQAEGRLSEYIKATGLQSRRDLDDLLARIRRNEPDLAPLPEETGTFTMQHSVDATRLGEYFPENSFEKILYNNPEAPDTDQLINDVLKSAPDILKPGGEIHFGVTSSTKARGLESLEAHKDRSPITIGERTYTVELRSASESPYAAPYPARRTTGGRLRSSRGPKRYYVFTLQPQLGTQP